MTMFEQLKAPFPPERISWRVGPTTADKKKGMALAYIDARDVMERLDSVCGPDGWQCRYPHANGKTVCEIGIYVKVTHALGIGDVTRSEWIWKADGAGDTDMEASKGALSDAFKRAAVRWGIGRYLYDTASPWVEIEQHGKSYSIKDSELPKLRRSLALAGADGGGDTSAGRITTATHIAPDRITTGTLPSNAELDAAAQTDDMIKEIRQQKSMKALKAWGTANATRAAGNQRVRDEYAKQQKALDAAERVSV